MDRYRGKIYALADEEISHVGEKMYSWKITSRAHQNIGRKHSFGSECKFKK